MGTFLTFSREHDPEHEQRGCVLKEEGWCKLFQFANLLVCVSICCTGALGRPLHPHCCTGKSQALFIMCSLLLTTPSEGKHGASSCSRPGTLSLPINDPCAACWHSLISWKKTGQVPGT